MQKLSNAEIEQMYNQVTELRNRVQTELDTLNLPFADGRSHAIPFPEAKERAMLKVLNGKLAEIKDDLNDYFKAHNHEKNIWD